MIDFFRVISAKVRGKPTALCDIGDVDGIASAAIFLRKYPDAVLVLRAPAQVQRSRWLRLFTWTFVADLPCPPGAKVRMRADHHRTNSPCAEQECYDPSAPCSAILAARLLGLENDPIVRELVDAAVQTDTANVTSEKVRKLDMVIRYSRYGTKLKIARVLAERGIDAVLALPEAQQALEKAQNAEQTINTICEKIPAEEIIILYFPKGRKLDISYRQLNIVLQKSKNAKFVNILVRRGFRTYRLYCGADREGPYDCTVITKQLGGGGHKFAAGAQYKSSILKPGEGFTRFVSILKDYLKIEKIRVFVIDENLKVVEVEI